MIPLFDLQAQYNSIKPKIDLAVSEVLSSGNYVMGERVAYFERACENYLGVKHAVACANGTDALALALMAIGILSKDDEVIIPALTFWGTAEAVYQAGGTPVLVDVLPSGLIDPFKTEKAITQNTKAIIPVHLYGNVANMQAICDLAHENGLFVITDNAQAFGATYQGQRDKTIGEMGCFSFFPTKPLGCAGDGGMIVTNNPALASTLRMLRSHGWKEKYHPEIIGRNSRLDEIQAAILLAKLPYVEHWRRQRIRIAKQYDDNITGNTPNPESAQHLYNLFCDTNKERDEIMSRLRSADIGCGVYYPVPLHMTKPLRNRYSPNAFPVATRISETSLAIPCYAEMTQNQTNRYL